MNECIDERLDKPLIQSFLVITPTQSRFIFRQAQSVVVVVYPHVIFNLQTAQLP